MYNNLKNYLPSPLLAGSRQKNQLFGIRHYAGEVFYDSTNFMEKNKDTVNPDIPKTLITSKNTIIKNIFSPDAPHLKAQKLPNKSDNAMRGATLTYKFKGQLDRLMTTLNQTNPAYVRCIKPNLKKQSGLFDSVEVQRQLRCAGMLEAIRIRKNGFGVRRIHQEFLDKYRIILGKKGRPEGIQDVKLLLEKMSFIPDLKPYMGKDKGLWALGRTKLFMKEDLLVHMDKALYSSLKKYIQRIQRCYRKYLMRNRLKKMKKIMSIAKSVKKLAFRQFKFKISYHYLIRSVRKIQKFAKSVRIREKFKMLWFALLDQKAGNRMNLLRGQTPQISTANTSPTKSIENGFSTVNISTTNNNNSRDESLTKYIKEVYNGGQEKDYFIGIILKLKNEIEEKRLENEELLKRLQNAEIPRQVLNL